MDANSVFKTILHLIEASQLNHSLSKTPFSASISLKSSFIKRFQGENIKHEVLVDNKTGTEVEKLRQENLELKESMKHLKQRLASQEKAIDEHLKQAKDKSKIDEEETATKREELIQIKKGKNKLGAQMKTLQGENVHLISEIKFFQNEDNECKKSLTKSTKKHDEKVKKLGREQELLKISEDRCQTQLLDLKLQIEKLKPTTENKESGNQTEFFECNICTKSYLAEHELTKHVNTNHCKKTKDSTSQTCELVNFIKYECFYCSFVIKSENSLSEHWTVCKQSGGKGLMKNVNMKHENLNKMETFQSYLLQNQASENSVMRCNIGQETFYFTTVFEMHKMFSHKEN